MGDFRDFFSVNGTPESTSVIDKALIQKTISFIRIAKFDDEVIQANVGQNLNLLNFVRYITNALISVKDIGISFVGILEIDSLNLTQTKLVDVTDLDHSDTDSTYFFGYSLEHCLITIDLSNADEDLINDAKVSD